MDISGNMELNLQNMLHACAAQAHWHHEQYLRLQYCQRYFTYLLEYREYFNENYLQNLFEKLSTKDDFTDDINMGEMEFTNFSETSTNLHNDTESPIRKKKRKRKSKVKAKTESREDRISKNSLTETYENESESGLDLDDDFKQFLKESAKFRAERDLQKNLLIKQDDPETHPVKEERVEVEYVDILRKGPDGSVLPPTAQNRKTLYEEKYGESGTTILSLETALQWKYNKFIDSTSPVTWPALPLRLIY